MNTKALEKKANEIRKDLIEMLLIAGSGHTAGPLGMADIFTALYFNVLNHNPKKPNWDGRDRLILSNGHIVPIRYVTMAHAGYFPKKELATLRQFGTRLQGHPNRLDLPGLETTAGPLGQGTSIALGMAIAAKQDGKKHMIYCITGDGELNEGQCWEAFMLGGKLKLNNLAVIVDRNNIQIDGYTEDVMPLDPLREKFESFGWHVVEINGHNMEEIINALELARSVYERPVAIIAHTIPGKGVDFMEFEPSWHGKPPKADEAKKALQQLRTLGGKIDCE
jgi:transketolase